MILSSENNYHSTSDAHVSVTTQGEVAVVTIDHPPVNALSRSVRRQLLDALSAVCADRQVKAVVLACAGRTFVAGAEIGEFADRSGVLMTSEPDPNEVIAAIERCGKPVVAALFGHALGGGLELAMGCHARIARVGVRIGLPEVTLGVIPGAGGTQRLPRLVGVALGLEMIVTGKMLGAQEALAAGLIDALVLAEDDLIAQAVAYAEKLLASETWTLARDRQIDDSEPTKRLFAMVRTEKPRNRAQTRARSAAIDAVEKALTLPFDEALRFEREQFVACNASPEAAALQHAFFAQRAATKIDGVSGATMRRPLASVGVVGGGTMGRGIAMAFANAGFPVILLEVSAIARDAALTGISAEYERAVKANRIDAKTALSCIKRVTGALNDAALATCDLVLEAVYENLDVKLAVCRRLGQIAKPGAIIATNTSTLDVDALAAATGRPQDVVGLHFFSPANVMKLLEIVRGKATLPDVLATVMALASRLGKVPVVSGVCYGFIGNRMLEGYLRETEAMLLEGLTPRRIDTALEQFGMAMGPCRMMDLAGVDVCAKVVDERGKEGKLPPDQTYRIVCRELAALGRFGQKSGSGFYRYDGRTARDDAVTDIFTRLATQAGINRRDDITDEEIVERCLLPLMNEGAHILDEGIAARRGDLDIVWLAGYGFPPERGGPMYYADTLGHQQVAERLGYYGRRSGNHFGYWTPAASLAS
ncbi:3-hydroxyacyl-CoA dehydrogenase NAD-binding domain-containing protein [Glaciimonas sp. PAMC28666]|uniref:3-hydroxyacyl-CoA dehydrogenase NAD-binding domain-containing protein n=1 Tax=Glaciimonas sp. PAMC28666 TaxID=2807626 RepID=UPI001964001D|nr:3-hydroxyacyl-CoA dehydrogenase NAD-binding domain-containing protein [Glaciimonas sp. PAMC28666]QRX81790.1 enoyl-CoA hydratase/isomerase family protein [Glaciimonas sp. PAMC28666]